MMRTVIGDSVLELVIGDITQEKTVAIVNAANSELAGGGGVDGAIHRAAGSLVMQQTAKNYPHGCPTGEAVITEAGKLEAKYIIHAVGPVWRGGSYREEELLRATYRHCLKLAVDYRCQSLSFPAISTGAYGYPLDLATEIALSEICQFLIEQNEPLLIRCVLFNEGIFGAYCRVLEQMNEADHE